MLETAKKGRDLAIANIREHIEYVVHKGTFWLNEQENAVDG